MKKGWSLMKILQVVIPHYFDVTRNERGIIDADCAELRQVCAKYIIFIVCIKHNRLCDMCDRIKTTLKTH